MNDLDYWLIYELQRNPRLTSLQLATQFGVSAANIRRRIAFLVSSGTLKITALPNPSQLGYRTRAFLGLQAEASRIKAIAAELKQYPELHYVSICAGSIDILTFGFFTSNGALSEFVATVLGEIPGIIRIDSMVVLKSFKFTVGRLQPGMHTPSGRLVDQKAAVRSSATHEASGGPSQSEIDELDYRIIVELQEDSRRSNRALARVLGVSESTVRRRIKDLITARTIELTAIPDPAKVGYPTHAFLQVQVDFSEVTRVAGVLVEYPEVHYVGICSGANQLLVTAMCRSPGELSDFITEELGKIPGIKRTETITHLKYEKRTFGWLQPVRNDTLPLSLEDKGNYVTTSA
jgi:DNA-binding Lrp family transcriptional regulator